MPSAALRGLGGAADASDGPRAAPLEPRAGMGVVFDAGHPEDQSEPGGPIFARRADGDGWMLRFGQPGPDLARVAPGQRVWVTSDPAIARETERMLAADEPTGRIALDARRAWARPASRCDVVAHARGDARAEAASASPLAPRVGGGPHAALLRDKLGAFGGTPFRVGALDDAALDAAAAPAGLGAEGAAPRAGRRAARRRSSAARVRAVAAGRSTPRLRAARGRSAPARWTPPERRRELVAALPHRRAARRRDRERRPRGRARLDGARRARRPSARARAARPARDARDRARAEAGRGGLRPPPRARSRPTPCWCATGARSRISSSSRPAATRPLLHGDFSLNVTNSITAAELFDRGLDTLTASHDLDRAQLMALLDARAARSASRSSSHHRIATFHTEHCVYAHLLSDGRDFRTCGRPCEQHEVALRDRTGRTHPVIVDVGCRNTVFNAEATIAPPTSCPSWSRAACAASASSSCASPPPRRRASSPRIASCSRGASRRPRSSAAPRARAVRRDARDDANAHRPRVDRYRVIVPSVPRVGSAIGGSYTK